MPDPTPNPPEPEPEPEPTPAPEIHRCEHCGEASRRVLFDAPLGKHLCHHCWAGTRPPNP